MQSRSIKPPTKAEFRRMARLTELGCVACAQNEHNMLLSPVEVHHLLDGGVRRGHAFTVGLCSWHHRGVVFVRKTVAEMTDGLGPSLYHDARSFHERYGSDEELLAYQNELLKQEGY